MFLEWKKKEFYYFSSSSSSSFVLFSLFLLLLLLYLLLISIVFPRKQRGQNQAYKAKLKCDGLILASLAFSRENNRNEKEVEEEGK